MVEKRFFQRVERVELLLVERGDLLRFLVESFELIGEPLLLR